MSPINPVVTRARAVRPFASSTSVRSPATVSSTGGSHGLVAVVVFSMIGLIVSLLLMFFRPGVLAALISQMQ